MSLGSKTKSVPVQQAEDPAIAAERERAKAEAAQLDEMRNARKRRGRGATFLASAPENPYGGASSIMGG